MPRSDRGSSIYIGNLPPDFQKRDLEDLFSKYGRIQYVDIKARPSRGNNAFAFVEYDDARDAEDAVRGRDGYDVDGFRLRVEATRGSGPRGPGGRPLNDSGRGGGGYDRGGDRGGGDRGDRRGGNAASFTRRRGFPVQVSGLPTTGSWQDLKDHMRSIGDIAFADVNRDGTGVVEFVREEDVKYAIRKLDDSKFTSHEGETGYIRLREGAPSSRSRSRSPRRDRDRSRSPRRDRERSRSRSPQRESRGRSPRYSRSRSRTPQSRSRSRSGSK